MKKYLKMSDFVVGKVQLSFNRNFDVCVSYDCADPDMLARKTMDAMEHAINSHDELVATNKELLAVVNNFHITEPDEDGCVWLVLNGNGTTGMAMFNLGNGDRIAAKVAIHLELDRKAAIAKAKAAS